MRATSSFLVVLMLATLASGCTVRTWIKPSEVAVLAKPPSEFRGQTPIRTFTGPDRRMVRVKGDQDVHLFLVGGGERRFEAPVVVKDLGDQRFAINGGGPQDYEFSVDTLSSVALERQSFWKAAAWVGLGAAVLTGVALVVAGFGGGIKVDNTTTSE